MTKSNIKNRNIQDYRISYDRWPISWFVGPSIKLGHFPPGYSNNILKNKLVTSVSTKVLERKENLKLNKLNNYKKLQKKQGEKEKQDSKNILFLVYTNAVLKAKNGFKIDRIESVVESLQRNSDEQNKLEFFPLIVDPLSHHGYKSITTTNSFLFEKCFHYFVDNVIIKKSRYDSFILSKRWKNKNNVVDFFFSREVIEILIKYYETFRKIILNQKIKAVCLTNATGIIDRCLIAAAHSCSIPSFVIQHGSGMFGMDLKLPPSTRYLVPGEKYKQNLMKNKVKQQNITITGPVYFDFLREYNKHIKNKKISSKNKKIQNNKKKQGNQGKNILFITSPVVDDKYMEKQKYFSYIKRYLTEIASIKNSSVIIKPHPREKFVKEYEKVVKNIKNSNKYSKKSNKLKAKIITSRKPELLYDVIHQSDVVVCSNSTVAIEAVLLGKKVINIDLHGLKKSKTYSSIVSDNKLAFDMKIDDNLAKNILQLDKNKKVIKNLENSKKIFIKKYCHKFDGKAGERTIKIILKALKKQ